MNHGVKIVIVSLIFLGIRSLNAYWDVLENGLPTYYLLVTFISDSMLILLAIKTYAWIIERTDPLIRSE